ncbi:urea transporter 2-like [Erpetoichthys calabaricus]|uniref:urea transporter 2-like n=1 Tax=Erpetoichthys calabaricus TaxID=27687 RepID=UPI0022345B34|nr:urea transporter 2-like [Erpetoichthys calabaricus]
MLHNVIDEMPDKNFVVQLLEWNLRGVSQVIMANNPLSGALILGALVLSSPWLTLAASVGLLSSTLTTIITGQESELYSQGLHGSNGFLVALLMAVFSAKGDWFWWLLIPCCLAAVSCTIIYGSLISLFEPMNLPLSVFPFNTILLLCLAATRPHHRFFPHVPASPIGDAAQGEECVCPNEQGDIREHKGLCQVIPLGVSQVFACDSLLSSFIIMLAITLFSPLVCLHALLGSITGMNAGLSLDVPHHSPYSGLTGFNGALSSITIVESFDTNWRTHLFSVASDWMIDSPTTFDVSL